MHNQLELTKRETFYTVKGLHCGLKNAFVNLDLRLTFYSLCVQEWTVTSRSMAHLRLTPLRLHMTTIV